MQLFSVVHPQVFPLEELTIDLTLTAGLYFVVWLANQTSGYINYWSSYYLSPMGTDDIVGMKVSFIKHVPYSIYYSYSNALFQIKV